MKKEIQEIESILSKLKSLQKSESLEIQMQPSELPFVVGEAYLIRTVTLYYTGRVSKIVGKFLILDECAWIPDTGRFQQAVENGSFNEQEPMGNGVRLNSDSIIDAVEIKYSLPTKQK